MNILLETALPIFDVKEWKDMEPWRLHFQLIFSNFPILLVQNLLCSFMLDA